ncbi:hypothetical protein RYX36_017736 [Vicia faba]
MIISLINLHHSATAAIPSHTPPVRSLSSSISVSTTGDRTSTFAKTLSSPFLQSDSADPNPSGGSRLQTSSSDTRFKNATQIE